MLFAGQVDGGNALGGVISPLVLNVFVVKQLLMLVMGTSE